MGNFFCFEVKNGKKLAILFLRICGGSQCIIESKLYIICNKQKLKVTCRMFAIKMVKIQIKKNSFKETPYIIHKYFLKGTFLYKYLRILIENI